MKFKGIEWEECSAKEWNVRFSTGRDRGHFKIKGKVISVQPKQKRCSKCGGVIKK